jgi:uncharacterized protein (DUF488 family)
VTRTHNSQASKCPLHGRDLIEVHKNLNINNQQFDKFKTHLKNIAQDMEVPIQDIDELLQNVEKHRDQIVFAK